MSKVVEQLSASGLLGDIKAMLVTPDGKKVYGRVDMRTIVKLRADKENFIETDLHHLHKDVGGDRVDFRGIKNKFGKGSLQIVISQETGVLYADVDKWNPAQDLVNWTGHTFGEVIPNWFKRVFKGQK